MSIHHTRLISEEGVTYKRKRRNLSKDLKSEVFDPLEIEKICEYFDQHLDQHDMDRLGEKLATESKINIQTWDHDNIQWQKETVKEIETLQKPIFFRHKVRVPEPSLNCSGGEKVHAVVFSGKIEMVLNENGEIPEPKRVRKPWSMTDQAEETDLTSDYWQIVQQNFLQWDDIKRSERPYHAGNSVILSQNSAVSIAHMHQWIFWNLASKGTKLYLMYPVHHSVRQHTYSVKTPRINLEEFLEKGTIGRISSSDDIVGAPQFLIAPSFTSHHVITANRSGKGYWGSGGFGSVNNLTNEAYTGR
jgi:hypothetical protein